MLCRTFHRSVHMQYCALINIEHWCASSCRHLASPEFAADPDMQAVSNIGNIACLCICNCWQPAWCMPAPLNMHRQIHAKAISSYQPNFLSLGLIRGVNRQWFGRPTCTKCSKAFNTRAPKQLRYCSDVVMKNGASTATRHLYSNLALQFLGAKLKVDWSTQIVMVQIKPRDYDCRTH